MALAERWRPTLKQTIGFGLAAAILATAAIMSAWSYVSTRSQLLGFSRELIRHNATIVREQVRGFLAPARSAATLTLALVESGMVETDSAPSLEKYFFEMLSVHPTVSMLNYGDEDGNFIMVKRQPDDSLSTKTITIADDGTRTVVWRHRDPGGPLEPPREIEEAPDDPYDPRGRPWYRGAVLDRDLHWTGVYVFFSDRKPGVTAAVPRFDPRGRPRGVLSVDIELIELSHFLAENIRVGESGEAFLLDEDLRLIAIPQADQLTVADESAGATGERLRSLREAPVPEVAALATLPAMQDYFATAFDQDGGADAGERTVRYSVDGKDYVATLVPVDVGENRRWLAGVVALEDEFLADAKRANLEALIAAGGFALVAMIFGFVFARLIGRSLSVLVDESARVRRLEIDSPPAGSRFREVDDVLRAFEGMKTGLRSFQKYVPVELVRSLIDRQQDATLGGEMRTLTIFFSDIRDFTTISEGLAPTELAENLARYLSVVTRCIRERHGTVDKYIGDGVMAFWGAPEDVADHAHQACFAALETIAAVDCLAADDPELPPFFTRIGVHTAEVVVGNFGSDERLDYTIIGDGVNLASRLEGVNKELGTQVLVSEETARAVSDAFETRRIGLITVKGREQPCATYELMGAKGEVAEDRVAAARIYEEALDLYLARDFTGAAERFRAAAELHPGDTAAELMAELAGDFAEFPPDDDWDGVLEMDTK